MRFAYSLLAFSLALLISTQSWAKIVDRIVAVVNGEVITLSELEKRAKPILQQYLKEIKNSAERDEKKKEILAKILPQLIDERLIEREIERLGIQVSDQDVNAALERICKENNLTVDELKDKLAAEGYTLEDYKKEIRDQIERTEVINAQVRAKIVVTNEQVLAYLREHPSGDAALQEEGPRYVLQHICIVPTDPNDPESVDKAREKAKEALAALKKGEDFAKVAAGYSDLPSARDGGFLGAFTAKEMAPFVKKAVLKLKPGEYSNIIDTPVGLQIFRLKAIETGTKDVDQAKMEEIRRMLYRQQINARFEQWLQELRSKSTIRILL